MNPLTREIWAVKYGNNAAQIFIGRDGYRKRAQELAEYEGHTASAIYENDRFEVVNGIPQHHFSFSNRGRVVGAYCVVYVKGRRVPFLEVVDLAEYNTGKSLWQSKPATMIKKVAEAQALRGAFQGIFGGTYSEAEEWEDQQHAPQQAQKQAPTADQLEKAYSAIEALTADEHPNYSRNSSLKHLGVESLRDCRDIEKLRAYYTYKKQQQKPATVEDVKEAFDGVEEVVTNQPKSE